MSLIRGSHLRGTAWTNATDRAPTGPGPPHRPSPRCPGRHRPRRAPRPGPVPSRRPGPLPPAGREPRPALATHQLAAGVQLAVELRHAQPVRGGLRARLGLHSRLRRRLHRRAAGRQPHQAGTAGTRTGGLRRQRPCAGAARPTPPRADLKGAAAPGVSGRDGRTRRCCRTKSFYLLENHASAPRRRGKRARRLR